MNIVDWVPGDALGLDFPAHAEALTAGGPAFLTRAFRASEVISTDNAVTAITGSREISGGSTGKKLLLRLEYAKAEAGLEQELFVKFSRAFDDPVRDAARVQMELEVHLALLSRDPNFPITVPVCYFSDYHHESGTGILITQRVPFGQHGVEPQFAKCLDYLMTKADAVEHYRALIKSLATLAGTHKAGKLPDMVELYFPFDTSKLVVSQRADYTPEEIRERIEFYADFARRFPQLLPENISSEAFITRLLDEGPRFQAQISKVRQLLQSRPEMIALCHWNAHIDNAWFWRDESGELKCGLMDWGNVSQMNVAIALWGCLSAAEPFIWNDHLDELLQLFVTSFTEAGGEALDVEELRRHLTLNVAMMGLTWMLDSAAMIVKKVPNLDKASDRFDDNVQRDERVRSQLLIMTVFLSLWQRTDMNALLGYLDCYWLSGEIHQSLSGPR
jgi:hypothetical protein